MARETRDAKGNLVGLTTSHAGDTEVHRDYSGKGGNWRRAMDALGGHKESAPSAAPAADTSSLKDKPVTIREEDLAKPHAFKKGGKVKKTGWAKVHKGEKIVAAEDAMSGKKKDKEKPTKSSKKEGKKPHRLHVRGAANGGYIVEHEFRNKAEDANPQENEEHQIADLDSLKDHIGEHASAMGGNADEEEEAQASPAPAA